MAAAENEEKRVELMQRAQWLRAAILGANDGLLSTTSLMLGIGAAKEDQRLMIISGLAGALAGACSMTVGEFVSVSTQREIEQKTIEKPNLETGVRKNNDVSNVDLEIVPNEANSSVTPIKQGLPHVFFSPPRSPFMKVIARDTRTDHEHEAGEAVLPNPYKAAVASGLAFLFGSLVPILSAMAFSRHNIRVVGIVILSSVALGVFGGVGARLGGSPVRASAMRVLVGGWISMAITYCLLKPFDNDHKGHGDID